MTIQEVREWLKKIEELDLVEGIKSKEHPDTLDQLKHCDEQHLHFLVLRSIADGDCEDPKECARLALESKKIDFKRFYPGYTVWKDNDGK